MEVALGGTWVDGMEAALRGAGVWEGCGLGKGLGAIAAGTTGAETGAQAANRKDKMARIIKNFFIIRP